MPIALYIVLAIFLWGTKQASSNSPSCGLRNMPLARIVGGSDALRSSWPWQVEILQLRKGDKFSHKCGGTLIDSQWVLTAAHCVFGDPDPKKYRVVLGQYDRTANDPGEREYAVVSVSVHEKYMTKVYAYGFDIALLKLAPPALDYPLKVLEACLPDQGQRVPVGTECFITGWGKTSSPDKSSFADILQEAKMPIVDYATCAAGNVKLTYAKVDDETMLCAGYGGDSVLSGCHGDSGGPFVCKESGRWVLRGAVSWGDHWCRDSKTFSVFVRISAFVDWIFTTMLAPDSTSDGVCTDYLPLKSYCTQWSTKYGLCKNEWYKNYLKKFCPMSCAYCAP